MLGEPLLRLDATDSTNRVALEWDEAPHGAAVVARLQSGGRGRLGRQWESAAGKGLYLSLVLRDVRQPGGMYSLLSALSIASSLQNSTGLKLRVKWPNDLICLSKTGQPRKIGGILSESRGDRLVVGIGINLNQTSDELPVRPIFPASSLHLESGQTYDVDRVLTALLAKLNDDFRALEEHGWSFFEAEFGRHCLGIGDVIRVVTGKEKWVGVFDKVGEDGALILRTADGLKRIFAGDVGYF